MTQVPHIRIRSVNEAQVNTNGAFVLYWMIAFRRIQWNFSLQRAAEWALGLGKPLLILEALRCDYPWASDRLHRFVLQGMEENAKRLEDRPVLYFPFVEREKGQGKGLLEALSTLACVVVTDDYPAFFLPRMVATAGRKLPVKLEAVDSNGLLPLRAADHVFYSAFLLRQFLHRELPNHLVEFPLEDPLAHLQVPPLHRLPKEVLQKWPPSTEDLPSLLAGALTGLPIDHSVGNAPVTGGSRAGEETLRSFVEEKVPLYHTGRNHPDEKATSGLSPYLHFGHVSVHQVFSELARAEGWSIEKLASKGGGRREGWWGMSPGAEAFLDELVTWRELGFNLCSRQDDYDRLHSLPPWALDDLLQHAADPRPYLYSLEEFEGAQTHDPLWNAAQIQLVREGRIHNYLRMLWGKKILHWSASPQEALEIMIELNNKYALDGRDPNSYTGIMWILGRYDRPWAPSRPVFGRVRYMSSRNTLRKLKVAEYLKKYR
ncbi:MAG: deoxyribodipyrimidine photolyase [Deltaproteobacteria bacterium]|nr:deoxyribodipyrimidine photolyase [Deltaproteobacteria bacterium]